MVRQSIKWNHGSGSTITDNIGVNFRGAFRAVMWGTEGLTPGADNNLNFSSDRHCVGLSRYRVVFLCPLCTLTQ